MAGRGARVCVVREKRGRFFLDFGRLAMPRRLYSFRGVAFTTREMAAGIASYVEMERAKGRPLDDILSELRPGGGEAAIAPLLERWLDLMQRESDAGIRSPNYVRELKRWAAAGGHFDFWSGMSVHEIDRGALREWAIVLAETKRKIRGETEPPPISGKTARNVMAGFHAFCEWVAEVRPSFTVPPNWPWPEAVDYLPTVLSLELQDAVLAEIDEERRGLYLAFARFGVRPSEGRVLRVRDWTSADELRVERARKGHSLVAPIRGPKKARGTKVLPLTHQVDGEVVKSNLLLWLEAHVSPERRLEDPDGPLFVNPRGRTGWWSETQSQEVWNDACARVGVDVKMYEGTKHSTATALKAAGVDDRVIAKILGHTDHRSVEKYGKVQTATVASALARLRPRKKSENDAE
jgi:integrase